MPKKDAYWFPHDANAQDDPKCMLLIDQLGMEGYGIYWALIERLRNEKDFSLPITLLNAFSKRWYSSKEKIEAVVKNYELFVIENDRFFSQRLKNSMEAKTTSARISAWKRWDNATALLPDSGGNADGIRKDANRREYKRKEKTVGVKFSADKTEVLFPDKTKQKLGESQLYELKQGRLLPRQIVKGHVY